MVYFDKKLVVVKVWIFELELTKNKMDSVFIWLKFSGLDVKY